MARVHRDDQSNASSKIPCSVRKSHFNIFGMYFEKVLAASTVKAAQSSKLSNFESFTKFQTDSNLNMEYSLKNNASSKSFSKFEIRKLAKNL